MRSCRSFPPVGPNTILRPKEHFVDQHGFTDQLFGLCHLLGYSLMPRLNVSKQQFYKLDRTMLYGRLDAVIRGTVDIALIREQWDQLVQVAALLHNRTAPAHVVLQRLASNAPSDRLAKALTALGQALRSLYLLRYLYEEDLRGRMQLQINRGEGRHQLARRLFFANQGAFQTVLRTQIGMFGPGGRVSRLHLLLKNSTFDAAQHGSSRMLSRTSSWPHLRRRMPCMEMTTSKRLSSATAHLKSKCPGIIPRGPCGGWSMWCRRMERRSLTALPPGQLAVRQASAARTRASPRRPRGRSRGRPSHP
jgi:Tn3 transposase DDE domain